MNADDMMRQGRRGEEMGRLFLKAMFNIDMSKGDNLFQLDFVVYKDENGKYFTVEIKHKEMFIAPPFDGQGLDIRQVKARMQFYKDTGIRCLFLVFDMDKRCYWKWLDELEQTRFFDTKRGIRIYNLKEFDGGMTLPEFLATRKKAS